MRQFEDINLNQSLESNKSECQPVISENEIIEQLDEINEDFLEETNNNDILSKNNKNNNPNYNKFLGLDGELNNKKILSFNQKKKQKKKKKWKKKIKIY